MANPYQNIFGNVIISKSARIGAYVEISGSEDNQTIIGNNSVISAFCFVPPGTRIGNDVFLAPRVTICNDKYPMSKRRNGDERDWQGVTILDSAIIGAGAVLLPGITIGKSAVIGAGAVVTKDVHDYQTIVGNPGRLL